VLYSSVSNIKAIILLIIINANLKVFFEINKTTQKRGIVLGAYIRMRNKQDIAVLSSVDYQKSREERHSVNRMLQHAESTRNQRSPAGSAHYF
jgi:hypothetical protein